MMVTRFGMSDKVAFQCKTDQMILYSSHILPSAGVTTSKSPNGVCVLLQLGVMTYSDVSKQSPETQAAIEQEVRILLKVGVTPQLYEQYRQTDHSQISGSFRTLTTVLRAS